MMDFTYTGLPARVIFGSGTIAQLSDEAVKCHVARPLVLSTAAQAETAGQVIAQSGLEAAGVFSEAAMHTPIDVTNTALAHFDELGADGIVAIGGGSTIGLGKAIALRTDAPQIVIPTSYAGSEMTSILGQTEEGKKVTLSSPKVLPETVIYDVDLTLTLPLQMTVTSGMNAVAHAVEAMYAANANPVLSLLAQEGISAMTTALQGLEQGWLGDRELRAQALYGAFLCAKCLGEGGVALHHKLCHVLGGSFDLPHAETHTVVLPHALAYNMPAIPDTAARLKKAVGSDSPAAALFDIAARAGVPTSLQQLGMPREGIERAVEISLENPYFNPRPIEAEPLREILEQAWLGKRPEC